MTLIALAGILLAPMSTWAAAPSVPAFGDAFWQHWNDGQAEVSSYDLVFSRYGEARTGTAVTIFVTETFSHEARVKANPGVHAPSDEYPVMKLNLVQDFATGVYDYNLMTSAFCAITARDGHAAGAPTKIVFASQEWCGQVFHELLPDAKQVRSISHSYFDGEGDRDRTLNYPDNALFEDGLLHWARGWTTPVLDAGESRPVELLRSAEYARMHHVPLEWESATVTRSADSTVLEVPAGSFRVFTLRVDIQGDDARGWTFLVDTKSPHRIVRWEKSDGRRADLVAVERMAYWKMNGPGGEAELERLGLSPRPARTP